MTTAAATEVRRPPAIRMLTVLLAVTAAATVVVELVNWWYAPEQAFGLTVRTGWAMLRSLAFLVLIWHVRRGRALARPFGLILAGTTAFAVGRLVVPREGLPPLPGVVGFAVLVGLCAAIVLLLYRSPQVRQFLVRYPSRLVVDRQGIWWREAAPSRPPVAAWLLTARVAALTYSPLMLVPCLVAIGRVVDGGLIAVPAVVLWLAAGFTASYAVLFCTIFLMRGRPWARRLLVAITAGVLLVDLPLCWLLLGADGLVRDGGPLVLAASTAMYALWRADRTSGVDARPDAPVPQPAR
jgi:hypothetical protein